MGYAKSNEKLLKQTEKKIKSIYSRAAKESGESWKAYLKEIEPEVNRAKELVAIAEKQGDEQAIRAAKANYGRIVREKTIMDNRYKTVTGELSRELADSSNIAMAYVNNQLPEVYAASFNGTATTVEKLVKNQAQSAVSFKTVNPRTVRNLAMKDETILPYKTVNDKKFVRWSTQKINAEVLQGIVQGDSIPEIADRLQKVTAMERDAAIRNARTAFNSAQNKGVHDCCVEAEEKGLVVEKIWVATSDDRTRQSHLEMDGVSIPIDEKFDFGDSKLEYPGDPNGDPAEVYNCRCTIKEHLVGFKNKDGSITTFKKIDSGLSSRHEDKIEAEKERRKLADDE